jgi:hypothetical protein
MQAGTAKTNEYFMGLSKDIARAFVRLYDTAGITDTLTVRCINNKTKEVEYLKPQDIAVMMDDDDDEVEEEEGGAADPRMSHIIADPLAGKSMLEKLWVSCLHLYEGCAPVLMDRVLCCV